MSDLLIVGAGPAGRALAHRAAAHGLAVTVLDPAPHRPWTMTIALFVDDLPAWLGAGVLAAVADEVVVYTPGRRRVPRGYGVLNTVALQEALSLDGVRVVTGAATLVTDTQVRTADGATLRARTVVDARGGTGVGDDVARQRAVGAFVPAAGREPEMVLMDWRGTSERHPSFSYRVRVDADRDLVEETSLAAAPTEVDLAELARRNARRGLGTQVGEPELVDFPLYATRTPWRAAPGAPLRFGAAGGLLNPATGYSVAESLRWAETLAAALAVGIDGGSALWPRSARWVYRLRLRGLAVLLRFDGPQLTAFFDAFFRLPPEVQRVYLSGRTDLAGVLRAMTAVFVRVPWRLQLAVLAGFVRPVRRGPAPGLRRWPCPRRAP